MKKDAKKLLKTIISSGKKFIAGTNLIVMTIAGSSCATSQQKQNKDIIEQAGDILSVHEIYDKNNKVILQEQYGDQDYKTCYINSKKPQAITTKKQEEYPTFLYPNFARGCVSAVYYIATEKDAQSKQDADIIRIQCDEDASEVDEIVYKKGTFNKSMACEVIKYYYTNVR